jgi:hypothetical protein
MLSFLFSELFSLSCVYSLFFIYLTFLDPFCLIFIISRVFIFLYLCISSFDTISVRSDVISLSYFIFPFIVTFLWCFVLVFFFIYFLGENLLFLLDFISTAGLLFPRILFWEFLFLSWSFFLQACSLSVASLYQFLESFDLSSCLEVFSPFIFPYLHIWTRSLDCFSTYILSVHFVYRQIRVFSLFVFSSHLKSTLTKNKYSLCTSLYSFFYHLY